VPLSGQGTRRGGSASFGAATRRLIRSSGIAGCLLWVYPVLGAAVVRGRDPTQYNAIDTSSALQVVFAVVCFLHVAKVFLGQRRGVFQFAFKPPLVFLLAFIVLCALSTCWSTKPLYTAYRAFECLTYFLLIVVSFANLRQSGTQQNMVEWIVMWAGWTLLWGVVTRVRLMGPGFLLSWYVFRTAYLDIGSVFFLVLFASRKSLVSVILIVFSLLSGANTTYFGIALGILPALVIGDNRAKKLFPFALGLVFLVPMMLGWENSLQETLWRGKGGVGLEYTHGRDKVWTYSIELGMEHPLIGYGFVAGESDALSAGEYRGAISAHNVFLSSFLAVGLSGPILMAVFFLTLFAAAVRRGTPVYWRSSLMGTVIMALTVSSANPGLGGRVYGSWMSVVMVAVFIAVLADPVSPGRHVCSQVPGYDTRPGRPPTARRAYDE
jgi:hypothetical protein